MGANMRYYNFEILIEKEESDNGYYAYCPNLPGCFSNGKTIEETKANIREAIELHLESLLKRKKKIPHNDRLVHMEEICIGVAN